MLGASAIGSGDGLRSQYIVVKVDHVDADKLKKKIADMGQSGAIAPLVVLATDNAPKAVLDVGLPIAAKQLEDFGVYASITAQDVPPPPGKPRSSSEFFPGAVVGICASTVVFGVGWGAWKALFSKIF